MLVIENKMRIRGDIAEREEQAKGRA